jgi:hypothetical protein
MDERPKRARLTPLSGELKAMVEWQPTDPTKEKPTKPRRGRRAPTTRTGAIVRGLMRLTVVLVVVGGGIAFVGSLIARHSDKPLSHVLPLSFYFAAAGVGGLAVLGGTTRTANYRALGGRGYDADERARAVGFSGALAALAIVLFAIGIALDYLL